MCEVFYSLLKGLCLNLFSHLNASHPHTVSLAKLKADMLFNLDLKHISGVCRWMLDII